MEPTPKPPPHFSTPAPPSQALRLLPSGRSPGLRSLRRHALLLVGFDVGVVAVDGAKTLMRYGEARGRMVEEREE